MQKIKITVDADANTTVEVEGVAGPSCRELTRGIESALGKATETKTTGDYHRKAKQSQQAKQH